MPQTSIYRHISMFHNPLRAHRPAEIKSFERSMDYLPYIRDPHEISRSVRPSPDSMPIPFLTTFHDGICYKDNQARYIYRGRTAMEEHLRRRHNRPIRKPGPQGNGAKGGIEGLIRARLIKGPTTCQTLFRNHQSSYFAVNCPRNKEGPSLPSPLLDLSVRIASRDPGHSTTSELQPLIDLQLAESEEGSTSQGDINVNLISQDIRHRSQWLHITEWPRFLEPHQGRLSEVAALIFLPDSDELYGHGVQGNQDSLLHVILLSLDRVIARARSSLKKGKLNVDQHRLNSFVARRSSQKPLIHDLKDKTYMNQLLVGERALLAVELDEADVPARALEEMQDRFMTKESRSPISWSLKLRAYGKAIQDNTTSLGQIIWSDNNEILTYKNMRFSMTGLRDLLTAEVKAAQDNLAELLLMPPDTERQEIVSTISLRSLMDDPSDGCPG
ncbi:uncharacterized protein FRV6_02726 [Fusarium oxysporum]|uniref:Uncharacterized protein n=1 Tax=Fusarium oxysporum TaxID=5507 RepID=A0A2H3T9V6_FUSOX|nr:uncharacterized protein FRV6_02726 [Fusarium oxysporum]